MSINKTPKTFEDFYVLDGKFEMNGTTKSYEHTWSAANEVARAEYEDKIKAMQAEIDDLLRIATWYKAQLSAEGYTMTNRYKFTCRKLEELNQRGEDEASTK